MESLLHTFLHADVALKHFALHHGLWVYAILFAIVFCETGLVFTPFLPGDSLLFATGALAAQGSIDPLLVMLLLVFAATSGDALNYGIGVRLGRGLFGRGWRFLTPLHLQRCESFYKLHGWNAIVLGRFLPVLRSVVPFVAGASRMGFRRFLRCSAVGSLLWVGIIVSAGLVFGRLPVVQQHFEVTVVAAVGAILAVSFAVSWRQARAAARVPLVQAD